MYEVLLVTHTILVLFLIVMVLIQRTDSDGLSGLGGGGGGGGGGNQFMTGRGSANLMTRATAILAGTFMFTSMLLAIMASRTNESSILDTIEPVPAVIEKIKSKPTVEAQKPDVSPAKQKPVVPKPE